MTGAKNPYSDQTKRDGTRVKMARVAIWLNCLFGRFMKAKFHILRKYGG